MDQHLRGQKHGMAGVGGGYWYPDLIIVNVLYVVFIL